MTIRVGILGCGRIARLHAQGYKAAADLCKVVVCCDEYDLELAKKFAQDLEAGATNRWQDVIERSDVDAISICLPPYQHAEVALAAAAAGKPIAAVNLGRTRADHLFALKVSAPSDKTLGDLAAMLPLERRRAS